MNKTKRVAWHKHLKAKKRYEEKARANRAAPTTPARPERPERSAAKRQPV